MGSFRMSSAIQKFCTINNNEEKERASGTIKPNIFEVIIKFYETYNNMSFKYVLILEKVLHSNK